MLPNQIMIPTVELEKISHIFRYDDALVIKLLPQGKNGWKVKLKDQIPYSYWHVEWRYLWLSVKCMYAVCIEFRFSATEANTVQYGLF